MLRGLLSFILIGWALLLNAESLPEAASQGEVGQVAIDSSRVIRMVERADSLAGLGNIPEAKTILEEAFKEAKKLDNTALTQWVQIERAENYLEYDQPDSAQKIIELTLDEIETDTVKAQALSLLGSAFRYQGRYDEALQKQEMAKALIDSSLKPGLYGRIDLNIGSIYSSKGDFGSAFKYFLSGINATEATGDSTSLAIGLNNVGVAYNNYGEFTKARSYLRRALAIEEKRNNKLGLLRATNNLAISVFKLKEYDEAIELYNRALALHNEVRPEIPPFRIFYNLGQIYKEMGDFTSAEDYYQQSLAYCKEAGIPIGLIHNYGGLADVAEQQGDYSKARDYYGRALGVARQIGTGTLEIAALNSLYNLEKNRNNAGQALSYYEQYVALNDSLNAIAEEQKLAETQASLSLRQQQYTNRLLQEKQEQQEARITAQNWLIAAGIGIIALILVSLFLLFRSNNENKKMNAELASQHIELEELNQVKDKMLAIIAHDLRSPLSAMHGMLYLMQDEQLSKDEIEEMITELNISVNQNISMMDNLLIWARQQMSGFELDLEIINTKEIVEEIFKNFIFQADHKGIQLINKTDPKLNIQADRNLLKLILRNLISNSVKFCRQGDIITVATDEQGKNAIFSIEDTGIGISDHILKDLFTLKGKSRKGTFNEKGSGLGLLLCKDFVEKQDGTMRVESEEGKGTQIIFSLPKA